jgi:DNA replication protein DnaC
MIEDLLVKLKMKGALASLPNLKELKDKEQLLIALLQAEVSHRENQIAKRRLSQAKFPVEKEWSDIDKELNPQIDFSSLEALDENQLIVKRSNLCLMGQQGTGKTHSLIALGRKFCRKGITTKFYTACSLVNALEEAKVNHNISKFMQSLTKPHLLIIDELGFVPFSENGARLLFDVFASRYERGAIAVSTNLSFDKWIQIFGTVELTAALVDRFTHRCLIYKFEGRSARLIEANQNRMKMTSSPLPAPSRVMAARQRRSSRRGSKDPRPLTPPYVRGRIRRFMITQTSYIPGFSLGYIPWIQ